MPPGMPEPDSPERLAERALAGDRDALEQLVGALQDPIYALCLRMLGRVEDARDAAQDILVRIVTHLSSFRGDARLTTWAYRIAANHLHDLARRPSEAVTFEEVDERLAQPGQPIEPTALAHASAELLAEETFVGCTLAILRCLDREHRLAFILGAILELDGNEAAAVLDVTPAAFRKRLSRARARLETFLRPRCGVMNPDAPCRCAHQVNVNVARGTLDPARLRLVDPQRRAAALGHVRDVRTVIDSVALFRRHPGVSAPGDLVAGLRALLHSGRVPGFH